MNKIRPIILAAVAVIAGALAYGMFTLPGPVPAVEEGFSSERVVNDLKVIAKEHHSVAHPEERAAVRTHLISRLKEMGGEIDIYQYDSLEARGFVFDAVDVVAKFDPLKAVEDTNYIMMVAHYDSRYGQEFLKDTVWSYGAADDGYGLGVILESVRCVLDQRENWNQGIKVLFTDGEEVGLIGMKQIWENNREVFDDVSLMINLEARGTYGPALLFETSPGNDKIIDLYGEYARYPFTYSLTTVVYKFLPNSTDFKVVKDDIPGMNFSTIADVNHYHTHLDNLENISEASIQHYGEQIVPMLEALLINPEYAQKDYFKSDKDLINFTIPGLGLFKFTKGGFIVLVIIIILLVILSFLFELMRGRIVPAKAFKTSGITLLAALGCLILGEVIAYICCLVTGATFKPFGIVMGISFDNIAMALSAVLTTVITLVIYLKGRGKAARSAAGSMRTSAVTNAVHKYAQQVLYGALGIMAVLALVLTFAIGESMMFIIPVGFAAVALILWRTTGLKLWLIAGIGLILLHALSFYYSLAIALSIGALGAVLFLAFFDIMVLIPMADLYITGNKPQGK